MNHDLFEKRIFFEVCMQILMNQQLISEALPSKPISGLVSDHTNHLITQCDAIVNKMLWEETLQGCEDASKT
jgi:hypothetical protein